MHYSSINLHKYAYLYHKKYLIGDQCVLHWLIILHPNSIKCIHREWIMGVDYVNWDKYYRNNAQGYDSIPRQSREIIPYTECNIK